MVSRNSCVVQASGYHLCVGQPFFCRARLATSYGFRHGAVTSTLEITGPAGIPVAAALAGNKKESMDAYAAAYMQRSVGRVAFQRALS